MNTVISFALVLLMSHVWGRGIPSYAGPYICYLENARPCEHGGKDGGEFHLRFSAYNPLKPFAKQLMTGNYTLNSPIDDNSAMYAWSDVFRNNQWKPNAFFFKYPRACSAVRDNYPTLYALFNGGKPAPKTGPCTIRAGFHNATRLVEWKFPNFPILPYGRYRFHVNIGPPEKQDAKCIVYIGNIVPRP